MTTAEAFKFGFLLRCAEEQLNSRQIARRVKLATLPGWLSAPFSAAGTAAAAVPGAVSTTKDLAIKSLLLSALAGGGAGATGGYMLAGAMDDGVDPADARDAETIAEYRRAIQELTRRRQLSHA